MKLLGDYVYECCLTNGDTLNDICIKQLKLILALVLDFFLIHMNVMFLNLGNLKMNGHQLPILEIEAPMS